MIVSIEFIVYRVAEMNSDSPNDINAQIQFGKLKRVAGSCKHELLAQKLSKS